jgi:hypothetical protein
MISHIIPCRSKMPRAGALLLCMIMTIPLIGTSNHGSLREASARRTDTLIVTRIYEYRTISTMYDSVVLACTYGEICIPGEDTVMVQMAGWRDLPGQDTSAAGVYGLAKTRPFWASPSVQLSLYRYLSMQPVDLNAPLFIPDTCSWIVELRSATTDALIAVLDSVGYCPQRCGNVNDYPVSFGTSNTAGNSFDMLHFDLSYYITEASSDSCYLRFNICIRNEAQTDFCNMYDTWRPNSKFSEDVQSSGNNQKRSLQQTGSPIDHISVFPSPANADSRLHVVTRTKTYVTIEVYNSLGALVKEVYRGFTGAGTNIFPIGPALPASGAYTISVKAADGTVMTTAQILYTK